MKGFRHQGCWTHSPSCTPTDVILLLFLYFILLFFLFPYTSVNFHSSNNILRLAAKLLSPSWYLSYDTHALAQLSKCPDSAEFKFSVTDQLSPWTEALRKLTVLLYLALTCLALPGNFILFITSNYIVPWQTSSEASLTVMRTMETTTAPLRMLWTY